MRGTGIFCMEGERGPRLTGRGSVEPLLRMLLEDGVADVVVHRDAATRAAFEYYLDNWLDAEYEDLPVGYLSFPAGHGVVELEDGSLTLEELAALVDGRAAGKTFYVGSCPTLADDADRLTGFCRETGAAALVGYTRTVDRLPGAAFDLLLLPEVLRGGDAGRIEPRLSHRHPDVAAALGVRVATASWASAL